MKMAENGYVELRACSAYTFLRAASNPEELVETAAALGYRALAMADLDGVYGIPRFVKACRSAGIRPICGARVTLGDTCATGPDVAPACGRRNRGAPPPAHGTAPTSELLLLCRDRMGWQNLCELLTAAHAGHEKGHALADMAMLERFHAGLVAIAGGRGGPVLAAAAHRGRDAGAAAAGRLAGIFGRENIRLDLVRHGDPGQERANRYLVDVAAGLDIDTIATNDVRYATPDRGRIMDLLLAIRNHTVLDESGAVLPRGHRFFLRAPSEMHRCFADMPGLVERTAELARSLPFDLTDTGYRFPEYPVNAPETEFDRLRALVTDGVRWRYGDPSPAVRAQIEHELSIIGKLELSGYFLLVNDIAGFCRDNGILAQGRGSAANSAVCYALGITAVDPIAMGLLFERFLSEERGEWPDIDLDLPSGDERERVIQHVYEKFGRDHVGMTAAVISFRGRNAAREVGAALGLEPERIARLTRLIRHYDFRDPGDTLSLHLRDAGLDPTDTRVAHFVDAWHAIQELPRHIGQHNGGLVISGTRLDRVVPIEPAAMPGRSVIQWDKDDIADMKLIKVDLLGLGMLAAISQTIELVRRHENVHVDLAHLPHDDPGVWDMLCAADTVGVFQIESRAQMATLPRMLPRRFYDLVVEVAIIRPGPIVGKMVHPYLERRAGRERVTYAAPCLEPILERTLGIPLFQEQLMRMVMAAAGFSAGDAEELRRAMGSRRSRRKMEQLVERMHSGMSANGIGPAARDEIVKSIVSFALYGFPESHAASFALIAFASAWLKKYHPAAFVTAILNCWPMGFYSPCTLVQDVMRHGVPVLPIDVNVSDWLCTLEPANTLTAPTGKNTSQTPHDEPIDARQAIRLGMRYINGLGETSARRIIAERAARGPYLDITAVGERAGIGRAELVLIADAGAAPKTGSRRDAVWQAMAFDAAAKLLHRNHDADALDAPDALAADDDFDNPDDARALLLPPQTAFDDMLDDFRSTGMTVGPHPMAFARELFGPHPPSRTAPADGTTSALRHDKPARPPSSVAAHERVFTARELAGLPDGMRASVAGMVIVRQRPPTARGFYFATVEDETGHAAVAVRPDLFAPNRVLLSTARFLVFSGVVQNRDGVVSLLADRFHPIDLPVKSLSRSFH